MIMAGGKGSRLGPLTTHRAKPSVPFAGRYRIIDFVLSNFLNSGYRRIYVLTQYMASSLIKHLNRTWHLGGGIGEYIEVVPAQMRKGEHWYRGTADSVFQNLNLVRDSRAEHVAVFGGDHIYKFAIDQMEAAHIAREADLTVAAYPVPRAQAHQFGVIQVDSDGRIIGFQEKPKDPMPIPGRPDWCLVSMGNYFFRAGVLEQVLTEEAETPGTAHDFGRNVIPRMVREGRPVFIYDFGDNSIPGEPDNAPAYWRDVGTIESYFEANMEVRKRIPAVNLYNREWRIRTAQRDYPPARVVRHGEGPASEILDSLMCEGTIIASATLSKVMLGYDCIVASGSTIENSVLLSGCNIGAGAKLNSVLLDKNCSIAPGAVIGHDPKRDRERFPFVTQSGIVVLPKGTFVPADGPVSFPHDMHELLSKDPATRDAMASLAERGGYVVADRGRHSFESAGPRYRRYTRAGVTPLGQSS